MILQALPDYKGDASASRKLLLYLIHKVTGAHAEDARCLNPCMTAMGPHWGQQNWVSAGAFAAATSTPLAVEPGKHRRPENRVMPVLVPIPALQEG